jgi:hypothetical protein
MQSNVICKSAGACGYHAILHWYRETLTTISNDSMNRLESDYEDHSAGLGTLSYSAVQESCSTYSKNIHHDEERADIQYEYPLSGRRPRRDNLLHSRYDFQFETFEYEL